MAGPEQRQFIEKVKQLFPVYFDDVSVFEAGSLNINGTARDFFSNTKEYLGCDLGEGPDVDVVGLAHELNLNNESFDVSISCECFEHNRYWSETFQKMYDVLRPNGLILITCATEGRAEHGTHNSDTGSSPFTLDYYRNITVQDFEDNFQISVMFKEFEFEINHNSHDLYFWGIKNGKRG